LASQEQTEAVYTLDNLPFKKAVFIDSTWNQCRGIYKDPRLNSLKTVIIQNRITKFWRHQRDAPAWYLATIEAIHQFLFEVHIAAWGINKNYFTTSLNDLELVDSNFIPSNKIIEAEEESSTLCNPYFGQYDNMLFFFAFMFNLVRYHNSLLEKNKPKAES